MKNKAHQRREWVRAKKFNKHHLTAKVRGGDSTESNLLYMDLRRHQAWHLLFNNLTLREIIELLERLEHIKEAKRFKAYLKRGE